MTLKRYVRKLLGRQTPHQARIALEHQARAASRILLAPPLAYAPEADPALVFDAMREARTLHRILEAGTLQAQPGVPTNWKRHFPEVGSENYVMMDLLPGPDVDVACDLHALPPEWTQSFDCFIANAVFEHLERPWIAAREVARILKPGGLFNVGTHQCFPIHGYPSDYFRFSREALRLIFEDAGLVVKAAEYGQRCMIVPPPDVLPHELLEQWNTTFPSYIFVQAVGYKP